MKNRWITIIAVVCILACSFLILGKLDYEMDTASSLNKNIQSKIEIKKQLIDIGKVKRNGIAKAVFKLINVGNSALIITDVHVDCHCTVADWSKEPVPPEDSTFIIVRYDSSQPGFFLKKVTVFSNAINSPTLLVLRGEIIIKNSTLTY